VRPEEAGALHRLRPHERRRDHRGEPGPDRLFDREVEQGDLQQRAGAGQEVEPGTGDLRAAFGVERPDPGPDLDVVADLEVVGRGLAHGLQQLEVVLATRRYAVDHHVGDRPVGRPQRLVGLRLLGLGRLHLVGEVLGVLKQRVTVVGRGLADLAAQRLLLGPQVVRGGDGGAPTFVRLEQRVDRGRVLAAGTLGRPDTVRVVTDQAEVDHDDPAYRGARAGPSCLSWSPSPTGP
jgi:hypothetical protein